MRKKSFGLLVCFISSHTLLLFLQSFLHSLLCPCSLMTLSLFPLTPLSLPFFYLTFIYHTFLLFFLPFISSLTLSSFLCVLCFSLSPSSFSSHFSFPHVFITHFYSSLSSSHFFLSSPPLFITHSSPFLHSTHWAC